MTQKTSHILSILAAWTVATLFLLLPLAQVFQQAFSQGWQGITGALSDPDAQSAIRLTLITAAISVPVNLIGGLAAAWSIAKFDFPGKALLVSIIELPFAISPVVSGLVWVLLFGAQGWFAGPLARWHLQIVFALPGIVLATIFVTFPFVARTILPLMQEQGREQEEAATMLGAGFFPTLWHVVLPDIKWALLSGVLLCNARAMGEFGAVSVVSGHVAGLTETMPLAIESLYNDYQSTAAFAMAALLACLGLVTLAAKTWLEWHITRTRRIAR
jgi:sulfate/thiosulfate transport system permease protein